MNQLFALTVNRTPEQEQKEAQERAQEATFEVWQVREGAPNLHRAQAAYWTNPRIRGEVYRKVAVVTTTGFDEVYYLTQNHPGYGWGSPADPNATSGAVIKTLAGVCRSTHVGDVILCHKKALMVNGMGWIDVSDPEMPGA